ncbi:GDP-mannose-dependent alpha-(1-6)-phosphatidylinositol monomannoside mannosyltransferase [mine drainage metagenome]|uniref:GDP-mannose-dependent alpha-(1-6)-phosphatidylinositol monomannoside mannosyltransferase n=1 Tax=mine drainage metagenome TaxID=410659 RepID=A0A1J5QPL1_9ZZZZ
MGEAVARSRVLLVTRNFPPLWGGMERLNWHMADELSREYAVTVVGPAGAAAQAPDNVTVIEVPLRPLWRFLLLASWRSLRAARRSRPSVVLAGSGLTAPMAWLAARLSGARCGAYVHGLDVIATHPVYRLVWRPFLRHMDRIIANSRHTAGLARSAGVDPARIEIVHPGVTLPTLDPQARARFRARHGLGEVPLLLSVGRLTARKGLAEFVAGVLPRIVAQRPDVHLVIVGDAPVDALYAQTQTPASIQAAANAAGVGKHLHFLGARFGAELADAFAGSDLHVFPVRALHNDPEGFGMVAVEAAAHGLPTVAYATGGVTDAVAEGESGALLAPGDDAGFAAATLRLLAQPIPPERGRRFAERFAWSWFGAAMAGQIARLLR